MDKRFEIYPVIGIWYWESMVMEEMGYGKYVDSRNIFDWDDFFEEKGIEHFTDRHYLENVLINSNDGEDFAYIDRSGYIDKGYCNERLEYGEKVVDIKEEIFSAAVRLFDKGLAPKEFIVLYR
jgi:hypothetical protein